jgi:hypothetical protein
MIVFETGPHRQTIGNQEKQTIQNALTKGSFEWKLNEIYNNRYHTIYGPLNPNMFLQELDLFVKSPHYKVIVMGGQHKDGGHETSMMFQKQEWYDGVFYHQPCFVSDVYVRFKIVMPQGHVRVLRELEENTVFHFFTKVPHIEKLPYYDAYKNNTVFVYDMERQFLPTFKGHKRLRFEFIS